MLGRFEFVESYDPAPFAFARTADGFHVDLRHLQILFALAGELRPRATLEIGCYHGYSSAAFVAMLNAGFVEEAHFIDTHPTDELHRVLALARIPRRTHLYGCMSRHAPVIDADFWLIDGCHHLPEAVLDVERAFAQKPALIAVHDTNNEHDVPIGWRESCRGSIEAGARLRLHPEYTTFHDCRLRPGEQTERGLTLGLRPDRVSEEIIDFARDLMASDQVWWVGE